MKSLLRLSLLVFLHIAPVWVLSQDTFQKVFPTLQPTWGDCTRRSHTGGLIFSSWAWNQFGSSSNDIALISIDNQGDTLWTKTYGRPFNDACFNLLATNDGGYMLTGYTETDASSDFGTPIYLIRTDGTGDTLWTRAFGAGRYHLGFDAVECTDGSFLVVGSWGGAYYDGLYILKVGALGDLMWTKHYDSQIQVGWNEWASTVSVQCILGTSNGDFFVAGDRAGFSGSFLAKLNSNGDVLWSGATSDIQFIDQLDPTSDGGLMISGSYDSKPLLVRLDANGESQWAKAYVGSASGGSIGSTITSDNGVALVAQTASSNTNSSNIYFLKTDSLGEVEYSRMFGDTLWDAGRGIIEVLNGGYLILGWSQSFGSNTAMYLIRTDSIGSSGCHEYFDATTAMNIDIAWDTLELESLSSATFQYPSSCSIRSGTTLRSLCPIDQVGHEESIRRLQPVQIFPNPARDRFTIVLNSVESTHTVEVWNAQGVQVYRNSDILTRTEISCSSWTSGVYFVKIINAHSSYVRKIVLE